MSGGRAEPVPGPPDGNAERVEVAIVGGGPAGLSAAIELRRRGASPVVVFEREVDAGGIPRHADHLGFGVRDLHRRPKWSRLRPPAGGGGAARRRRAAQSRAGHRLEPRRSARGHLAARSRRSSKCRPWCWRRGAGNARASARLIPGTRPEGVITTGMLQQIVHGTPRSGWPRAVVIGAEHVSVLGACVAGAGRRQDGGDGRPSCRVSSLRRVPRAAAARWRLRLRTRTALASEIHGARRVQAVSSRTWTRARSRPSNATWSS